MNKLATLVVGASGATGKLLVERLLESGQKIKVIVRSTSNIPDHWNTIENLTIIKRKIAEITPEEMSEYIADCQAVASCLGHTMTWNGIYGKPEKLVTDTVRLLCEAIIKNASERPIKFVLMNTAGNSNRDIYEPVSVGEKMVIGMIRLLLPPHPDNEKAADYLRLKVGQNNPNIEWVVVRPDTLINEENFSEYSLHKSPTRSAIFNPGKTSRINVGHFMARLILDDDLWSTWKGQMPVIYNVTKLTE
ncbi:NAD(P)-binding oxidoreductase [Algoriphagus sp. D3-2-R+10]|uniref:NAD(P)-dependent oxidoreductase n=1 Tax=Algoriphagus aurantiacus TaxID=3103948 RepID=UPI002B3ADD3C|nr:NAD(P)-binding oxidoreductase [Algoriphagus sp. D3-2-R+10]MEB2778681.1 NAD(P)-binding oxidoreductase [Algoriphagus sp. D3-2-R+10]